MYIEMGGGVEGGFTAVSVSLLEGCQCSEGKGGMTLTPDHRLGIHQKMEACDFSYYIEKASNVGAGSTHCH